MKGGSPVSVVMRGDSSSEGCWFESQPRILDGNFCKKCIACLKKTKIIEKRTGMVHLKISENEIFLNLRISASVFDFV